VIVLRGQTLDEDAQVRFAERFGQLSPIHTSHHLGGNRAVMYIGNLKRDGKMVGALPLGEMHFHSDQCYQERPALGTMLYSIEVPSAGGNTLFANGYKAYDALPAEVKESVRGLKALNVYDYDGGVVERKNMVAPEDGIAFALNRMIIGGFRHIPIVDDAGAPHAVLSLREVVAFIVSLLPHRFLNLPPEPMHEARSTDGG